MTRLLSLALNSSRDESTRSFGSTSLWIVATLMLVGLPALAQKRETSSPTVERELRLLNQQAAEMQVKNDAAAAARLLADEYIFLQADGAITNKVQNVAGIGSPDFKCQSMKTEDVQVKVYGDVALVYGRAIMEATIKGKPIGGEFLYSDVWVKRAGRWQTVHSQATLLPSTGR